MRQIIELSADPASAGESRRLVADLAAAHGYAEQVDVAALLVSELVSNVVAHTGGGGALVVDIDERRLRVEVIDASDVVPEHRDDPDPLAVGGRGLLLVSSLSARHGVDQRPEGGKAVWFELDGPSAP